MLQPPTDNLYKFLAISGLLAVGFCIAFPLKSLYELRKETTRLAGEAAILNLQLTESQSSLEMKIKREELATRAKLQLVAVSQVRYYVYVLGVGAVIGSLMVFFGFYYWYQKVQKLQDQIIANQASSVKPEQAAASSEQRNPTV